MFDYDLEPPNHAQRWRGYSPTPEQEKEDLVSCLKMKLHAEEAQDYDLRCLYGEKVFYFDYFKGLTPGHIYSDNGRAEFGISRTCEFHFDEMFKEPDQEG